MFYDEAMEYIRGIEADGSDYGLERERALLDALGSPDDSLRIVHVAGTNGKGSVCAMLTSVLVAAGFRVGTYNSPSVLRYNERFLLDGVPLSDDKVAHYMTVVRDAAERERAARAAGADEGAASGEARAMRAFRPTAFEQETALALTAFKEEGCDWAVLETGLGGRWDATNAVHSKELAVITKIGYDHCALLGNTLKEIASEKAAIIKGAAVTCAQEADAAEVLYPAVTRVSGGAELISRAEVRQRRRGVCHIPARQASDGERSPRGGGGAHAPRKRCGHPRKRFERGVEKGGMAHAFRGAHSGEFRSIAICARGIFPFRAHCRRGRDACGQGLPLGDFRRFGRGGEGLRRHPRLAARARGRGARRLYRGGRGHTRRGLRRSERGAFPCARVRCGSGGGVRVAHPLPRAGERARNKELNYPKTVRTLSAR